MSDPYGIEYTVVSGDWLDKIARNHGLASWKDIYYHPKNAAFRKLRPDPNKIYPGDIVWIPQPKPKGAKPTVPPAKPPSKPPPKGKKPGKPPGKPKGKKPGSIPGKHKGIPTHRKTHYRKEPLALKFYADTDHTGHVDESETEWSKRQKKPGATLMFNCDRDKAVVSGLDFEDDLIVSADDLNDISKFVVKQNSALPKSCKAWVTLVSADAKKVRGFDNHAAGATAVLGQVGGGTKQEFELSDIRTRDYVFAFEAIKAIHKRGDETIKVGIKIKRGSGVVFDDYCYFTIAPWLMLSNVENGEEAYVVSTTDNAGFRGKLKGILGGRLQVIKPSAGDLDRWIQDIIEVGYSSSPAPIPYARPFEMHQFINSKNANPGRRPSRGRLFTEVKKALIDSDFGHVEFSTSGFNSMDSFGNLEVTPPLPKHPYGRIFYGTRDTSYSRGHAGDEMGSDVVTFLRANKYQPAVEIPTCWLHVGHVDEFLSYLPNLKGGANAFKLFVASPRWATELCRQLKKAGRGSELICRGKGAGYTIPVNDFLSDRYGLLRLNKRIQALIDRITREILQGKLGIPSGDIVQIPVIFNGRLGSGKRVDRAIARTGGMVNCLVMKPDVIVPKPFGPKDAGGKDVFWEDMKAKLAGLGLKPHPVDDWDTYHTKAGEIHCGTNSKRTPPDNWEWWRRDLKIAGSKVHG